MHRRGTSVPEHALGCPAWPAPSSTTSEHHRVDMSGDETGSFRTQRLPREPHQSRERAADTTSAKASEAQLYTTTPRSARTAVPRCPRPSSSRPSSGTAWPSRGTPPSHELEHEKRLTLCNPGVPARAPLRSLLAPPTTTRTPREPCAGAEEERTVYRLYTQISPLKKTHQKLNEWPYLTILPD